MYNVDPLLKVATETYIEGDKNRSELAHTVDEKISQQFDTTKEVIYKALDGISYIHQGMFILGLPAASKLEEAYNKIYESFTQLEKIYREGYMNKVTHSIKQGEIWTANVLKALVENAVKEADSKE
jgi:hypothetical protein